MNEYISFLGRVVILSPLFASMHDEMTSCFVLVHVVAGLFCCLHYYYY